MKKLSKLLLTFILFFTISQPIIASAQENNENEQTEEQNTEEDNQEENENENTDEEIDEETGEGTPVDENNEEPNIDVDPHPNQVYQDSEIIRQPVETPASVTGERFQGLGTVVDFTTHGSREIYTIDTPDNSVFYLMIDWDMTENNVYFLTSVNDNDLTVENVQEEPLQSTNQVPEVSEETNEVDSTENVTEATEEEAEGSNLTFWILLILMTLGILGYHLFFGKLKNLNPLTKDNDKDPEDDDANENDAQEQKDVYLESDRSFASDSEDPENNEQEDES